MNRWPTSALLDLCSPKQWPTISTTDLTKTGFPVYGANGFIGYFNNYNHEDPTILVTCRGATCGKLNISPPRTYVTGNAMSLDNPRSEIINFRFLFYALLNRGFNDVITGAAQPQITRANISRVSIPVPPLGEQKRIVNLLDDADEVRNLRARADRRTADLIPALFHEMFGDPTLNPHGWPKSTLEHACQKLTDGTHFSPPSAQMGVPYITAKHLREHGLDFDRDPTYVSTEHHREIYARCDPKRGDVIYIKDGVTTGLAAVNRYDYEFSMLSSLALMRPDTAKCDSEFLCAWLNDKAVKASMLGQMAGAAIRRLTLVKLKRASILLPPVTLQKEFAMRVTEIRELEAKQAASRERLDALFQSMLHRAFRGEL